MREIFAKLRIHRLMIPYYVSGFRKGIRGNFDQLRLHHQILSVFAWARASNTRLAILSLNSTEVVQRFVATHIPTVSFRRSVEQSVYLGDENRDVEAAHRVGMRSIAVTWGKDSANLLLIGKPNFLARDGAQIVSYLESLNRRAA